MPLSFKNGTKINRSPTFYFPLSYHKRTLVAMSERTGMSVSQVTDEVLYTGLVEMQEMDELED